MKSVNKHMCFLTFWDNTGVPDDAKMSQEEEPEDQEDNKNKEIKKKIQKREK